MWLGFAGWFTLYKIGSSADIPRIHYSTVQYMSVTRLSRFHFHLLAAFSSDVYKHVAWCPILVVDNNSAVVVEPLVPWWEHFIQLYDSDKRPRSILTKRLLHIFSKQMPRKKDSVARHNKSDKIPGGITPTTRRMNSLLAPPKAALSQGRQFFGRMMELGDLPPLYPIPVCNKTHTSSLAIGGYTPPNPRGSCTYSPMIL